MSDVHIGKLLDQTPRVCFQIIINPVKLGCRKHTCAYHGNRTESCYYKTLDALISFPWFKQRHERNTSNDKSNCLCRQNSLGEKSPKWHQLKIHLTLDIGIRSHVPSFILSASDQHQPMANPEPQPSPWNLAFGSQPEGRAWKKDTAKITALVLLLGQLTDTLLKATFPLREEFQDGNNYWHPIPPNP